MVWLGRVVAVGTDLLTADLRTKLASCESFEVADALADAVNGRPSPFASHGCGSEGPGVRDDYDD